MQIGTEMKISEEANEQLAMNPKKFAVWLFMASITMLFASLTSAYIVRQGEGNWMEFPLPSLFWVTSVVIIASSGTMHWAYLAAKKDNLETLRLALTITTLLGIGFLVGQIIGWGQLIDEKVYLTSKDASAVSGSFVYVLSGLHWLHIVSGVIYLLIVLVAAFRFKVHSKNLGRIEMCASYWHFLDVLWLFLFGFLLIYR